jgi:large subunit ribosomal protein L7/L12
MADLVRLVEDLSNLSVLEAADLAKMLEEKWGVTAAAPVAVAAAPVATAVAEEQKEFDVVLVDGGSNKIAVIKLLREQDASLALKDAKDKVEGAPQTIKAGVSKEEAQKIREEFEKAGAKIEVK